MTTVRGVAYTLLFIALMAPVQADLPAIPFEDVTRYWERPPEEELEPLPSLDPSEREELRERLDALMQLYDAKVWELRAEHYGLALEQLMRQIHAEGTDGLADWWEVSQTIRPQLRPEHDPWAVETALGLVQEDPIDWEALKVAIGILNRSDTGPAPAREALARRILAEPVHPDQPNDRVLATNAAILYFVRHWPDDAPEILEVICTLPDQPRERDILPVAQDARRPTQEERRWARTAQLWFQGRGRKAAEVLERIEASVETGEYTLDQESGYGLDRLRRYAREGVWWRRLLPW